MDCVKYLLDYNNPWFALFRIVVRAVSALGESGDSNPVTLNPENEEEGQPKPTQQDDSDKDQDSSEDKGPHDTNTG